MLLNATASWIWQHRFDHDVAHAYADRYGVSVDLAGQDISRMIAAWDSALPSSLELTLQIDHSTFRVVLETPALIHELLPRIEALQTAHRDTVDHTFRLYETFNAFHLEKDGAPFAVEGLVTAIRGHLLQELTRLAEPNRDFFAILHAGVCGNDSDAIILAGPSFAGKSTVCHALMQSGLICYSDDSACLTTSFELAGMPFALAMREEPRFRPSNLNGTSPLAKPKALVFVNYQADAPAADMKPIPDTFDTLLAVQESGFWIQHTQPAIEAFLQWLAGIPAFRLTYSEVTAALPLLTALL